MRTSPIILCLSAALILGSPPLFAQSQKGVPNHTDLPSQGSVRYSVTIDGQRTILLDSASGQTWLLTPSANHGEPPAWLPIERIDDTETVSQPRRQVRSEQSSARNTSERAMILDLQQRVEQLELGEHPAQELRVRELFPLILKEEELLKTHGEEHPEVLKLRKQIELTRSFHRWSFQPAPGRPRPSQEAVEKELLPLILQEQELLDTHGEEHPEVISIRRKIERTRSFLRNSRLGSGL